MQVPGPDAEIETSRLRLRQPVAADAERLAGLLSESDIPRMMVAMPWPYTIADAHDFIERAATQDHRVRNNFLIEHPAHGMVGGIGLFMEEGVPELGYWIGRSYRKNGFATEAVEAALVWASTAWGKRFVRAGHFVDNAASAVVLQKAGFLYTGEVVVRASRGRAAEVPMRTMVWLA
jgi:RimJ/RimL family protein N-acetyltransferase